MNISKYKSILFLSILSLIAFIIHQFIFDFLKVNTKQFTYSLETLYLLFYGLSIIVFMVLLKVKENSFDNIGMSFLLATSLKMVICYSILKPILVANANGNSIEKISFFMMFILFLAIETIITIRILNEKQ
ncbi:DUF6168 family protein [Flavobacterium ovatum]|uniref:DUF6168 family protein n=1 Tax=Flavobacterium ovatum TaxID=1928857 RepID=UPI00344DE081